MELVSWVMATSWTDEMCVKSYVSFLTVTSVCHYTNMTKSTKSVYSRFVYKG